MNAANLRTCTYINVSRNVLQYSTVNADSDFADLFTDFSEWIDSLHTSHFLSLNV